MKKANKLIFYYGKECPYCHKMMPLVEKLEKEEGIKFTKKEVWHDLGNRVDLEKDNQDGALCGGVPFMFNSDTKKYICGSVEYEKLKDWALGKGDE